MLRAYKIAALFVVCAAGVALASSVSGCDGIIGITDITAPSDASPGDGGALDVTMDQAADTLSPQTDGSQQRDSQTSPETGVDSSSGGMEAGCPTGDLACSGGCVPNDPHNCGTCGNDCTNLPHVNGSQVACAGGTCVFDAGACSPGYGHCGTGGPEQGCETQISGTSNCGGCGVTCMGGMPDCSGSGSTYSCTSGCSGQTPTLCGSSCVNTDTDNSHCGNCTTQCSPGTTCQGGSCVCNTSSSCNGCCSSATTCKPFASESATSCGNGGATCAGCADPNQICTSVANGGNCQCPPNPVCTVGNTQCQGSGGYVTCNSCGQWGTAVTNCGVNTACQGGACGTVCTKTVTSGIFEMIPASGPSYQINYEMVGGGGGGNSTGDGTGGGGGGGGSSAILVTPSGSTTPNLIAYAAGGNAGSPGIGNTSTAPFTLNPGDTITVNVGGGGGGGCDGASSVGGGGGGGAGYYGGGGGGYPQGSAEIGGYGGGLSGGAAGGPSTSSMGVAAATAGSMGMGGTGATIHAGFPGPGGNGNSGGIVSNAPSGGGGGGAGGGGGGGSNVRADSGGYGGSTGANGSPAASGALGGTGANTWSSATSLSSTTAGAGGNSYAGGNAGLVILHYIAPPGSGCPL